LAQRSPAAPWWKNTRGEYYLIVQAPLFALIAAGPWLIDARPDLPPLARAAALLLGAVLIAAGGLLSTAGLLRLGRNLSALPHPKDDAEMVAAGVYSLVRHPIYGGLIIAAAGWGLFHRSVLTLGLALALFIFFDVKSRREERYLVRRFPAYARYRTRVRKLIPFVY
jgi:protein-S-isoprenylcysteine O-methyltransferase Ste14